jgi:hypothetical protein
MDEVVALARIHRLSEEGGYDSVFVDAAPTGETIRLKASRRARVTPLKAFKDAVVPPKKK